MSNFNPRNPAALKAWLAGDLENALVASTPGGIEAQEAAGQRELVASERLPKEGTITTRFGEGTPYRATLEQLGFVFGEDIDKVFVACTLPPGWRKEATDHAMWSRLLDADGHERAAIFFKAAFYDYHAHVSWTPRYQLRHHYAASPTLPEKYDQQSRQGYSVIDHQSDAIMWVSPALALDTDSSAYRDGLAWLREKYPLHENPFAYWGEAEQENGTLV